MKYISQILCVATAALLAACSSSKQLPMEGGYNQVYDATQSHGGSKAKVTISSGNTRTPAPSKPAETSRAAIPQTKMDWRNMDLLTFFNDAQRLQLEAAKAQGIEPMHDNSNIFPLMVKGNLVKIATCDEYVLANLSHSYPYLVPAAADMLKEIGRRVQEITGTKSRILVTSCLRTVEKQMDLSETNQNAASYSCHYYGTTFDLAYNAAGELLGGISYETYFEALCQAVHEMRLRGRLYIKYETGQHCLHMTVRP